MSILSWVQDGVSRLHSVAEWTRLASITQRGAMNKTVAGRYDIERELGQGGMGVVYRAQDTKLQCTVALKAVAPHLVQNEDARKRIEREAHTAAVLTHPYVCKIFDTVEDEGQTYIVMEFCEGQTLEGATIEPVEAARLAIEVAEALEEAAGKGIVHRDLKPGNLMLTRSGHIKVMDFGLAKTVASPGSIQGGAPVSATTALTGEGQIVGSTPYMSPEQLRGEPLDVRSDIFSFGATLYELLTGHKPFYGASAAEIVASILSDEPEPMIRFRRGVPEPFERIVRKMLAKDRSARYQSATEVRLDLQQVGKARPALQALPWNLRWRWIAAAALLIAAVASLVVWQRTTGGGQSTSSPPEPAASVATAEVPLQRARLLSRQLSLSANSTAITLLEEYINQSPDSAQAHSALAVEKLKKFWWYQGDPGLVAEARRGASHALKLDARLVQPRAIVAICATLGSAEPEGYFELVRCLHDDPAQPESLAWLATFLNKSGELELARELIRRLQSKDPDSPYVLPLFTMNDIRRGDFQSARKSIVAMQLRFQDWDGSAYALKEEAIQLADMRLLEQAIKELTLINPKDPSLGFWRAYVQVARGADISLRDLEALTPYLEDDYELSAFFAQICARSGNREDALKWLQQSIDKGNYDLLQLDHGDFSPLRADPRFVALKASLCQRADSITTQIRKGVR